MQTQNYKNHRRLVPGYHLALLPLLLAILGGSVWNFYRAYDALSGRLSAALIFALAIACVFFYIYSRGFALKAQDRAIRAEENMRHFFLTGKPLNSSLRMGQIIALRFADDAQFVSLAEKAVQDNMRADAIKQEIQNWKADTYRV